MNAASELGTSNLALGHQAKIHSITEKKDSFVTSLPSSATHTQLDENEAEYETPSKEEMKTLRRVSGQIPWTAYTIAFVELCERFSYYGTTAVCE